MKITAMRAEEMLLLTDEQLEAMRDPKVHMQLKAHDFYVFGPRGRAVVLGSLEAAVEEAFALNDEHVIFYIKAYQHLKAINWRPKT